MDTKMEHEEATGTTAETRPTVVQEEVPASQADGLEHSSAQDTQPAPPQRSIWGFSLSGEPVTSPPQSKHRKLPDERKGVTHKFGVNGHEGYITLGLYDDEKLGEMFIVIAKEGSITSGLLDVLATTTSIALQHGVPLKKIIEKWLNQRFDPSGFTKNSDIPLAKSIVDYLARWLAFKFLSPEELVELKLAAGGNPTPKKDDVTALSE